MDSPGVGTPPPGPSVDPVTHAVTFRVEADDRSIPIRVWYHLRVNGADPTFHLEGTQWVASIPRPPVARMEYLLHVDWGDGGESLVPDPANPRRVRSVFGEKSVIEFPGYTPPGWLEAAGPTLTSPPGESLLQPPESGSGVAGMSGRPQHHDDRIRRGHLAAGRTAGALVVDSGTADVVDAQAAVAVTGRMHVPADSTPDEPLPLLVVHDGPEYADLAELLRYVTMLASTEPGLRCRVLLLQPIDRDRSYSASPAYGRALVTRMLPSVTEAFATSARPVGVGASLGGLAMLHAAMSHPGTFAGVFSQSGSFFRRDTDAMELHYRYFDRIVRFVDDIDVDPRRLADLRVTMTCGTGEENLANNRSLARRLTRIGVPVAFQENPDGHNYTGWRDSLDPGLGDLLRSAWLPTSGP